MQSAVAASSILIDIFFPIVWRTRLAQMRQRTHLQA
ncbi:hypothetical protein L485_03270 [Sphingobium baderi LL03]|uniref:Uncharacterized protein n=1 Tax=Sphingobium baderi LL03 TaxID=1114964 RepID=T0GWT2_9SPHN|nr:hypothetical protein L485_03270 [Sphingobium baderi LL03]